jgi:hypothetical protein
MPQSVVRSVRRAADRFDVEEASMSEAGIWVAWGIPARGRERQALDLLRETASGYLDTLRDAGRIERFDVAILRPQSTELGGFILIQGSKDQVDALRTDHEFEVWLTRVQLVADRVGVVDAWVGDGLSEAIDLYEEAIAEMGSPPQ